MHYEKCWCSLQIITALETARVRWVFGITEAFRLTRDRATRGTHLHDTVISTFVAGITAASGSKSARLAMFTKPLITVDMLPRTDTASVPRSVDLERGVCVCEGVTTLHARRHRRASNPRVRIPARHARQWAPRCVTARRVNPPQTKTSSCLGNTLF